MTYRELPPSHPAAGRLGRHRADHPRNAAYPYIFPAGLAIASVLWARHAPIFDQGNLGSCTGNAICGAVACDPEYGALPSGHPALGEAEAVALYSAATRLDPFPGAYPPDDTGSDGTSACQAAKNAGLISGYTHCTTLDVMLAALQAGPVIAGYDWWSSFDYPAPDGTIELAPGAYIRGGHETLIRGCDTAAEVLLADNSWGTSWGDAGSFRIPYAVMSRLLADGGDCNVPLPLTATPPVPIPVTGRVRTPPPGIWQGTGRFTGTGTDGRPWHTDYSIPSGQWTRPVSP